MKRFQDVKAVIGITNIDALKPEFTCERSGVYRYMIAVFVHSNTILQIKMPYNLSLPVQDPVYI
jgi:hypothetical protein